MLKIFKFSFIIILTGCHQFIPQPDDPRFAPAVPAVAEQKSLTNGSLFLTSRNLSLYQDIKAYNVGDILTVKLSEKTNAKKDAETNFNKSYTNKLGTSSPTTIMGLNPKIRVGKVPFVNTHKFGNLSNTIDYSAGFKGKGDGKQSNELNGNITVSVAQVLPNNNLFIKGEKWLTLNQGSEFIRLSGIVRSQDINPDNEIDSYKIANARIEYRGSGVLADASNAGWLSKFFNNPLWFF